MNWRGVFVAVALAVVANIAAQYAINNVRVVRDFVR